MPKVKRSYVYFTCISCGTERYKSLKRYEKMLEKQTAEEIDATFKCGPCKRQEKAPAAPTETTA